MFFKSSKEKENTFLNKFINIYLLTLLILLCFVIGLVVGQQSEKTANNAQVEKIGKVYNERVKPGFLSKDVNFDLFWQTWQTIKDNYVHQPVNESELLYGAMAGSVAALGDPHSVFFDPEMTQKFTQELNGTFDGIGAEIAIKKDKLTIVAALPDTPAEKAGLRTGDKIYAIDGEDTTGMSLDYAVSKIRGLRGTEVVLTINREGWEKPKEFKLARDQIKIQSVKWKLLENNLALIQLRYFNGDTEAEFKKTVMEVVAKNPQGIILDLRNNPGGYLDTAIAVASEWVENGVIVYEKDANGKLNEHQSKGQSPFKDFPTVVLINEGSASGSEIVAGALKDHQVATLIGEKSFGKGSVQSLFQLDDGSSIKLTIAEWLTPNQNAIDGQGIEPDIKIELTDEDFNSDKDPQLDKAIEVLKTRK